MCGIAGFIGVGTKGTVEDMVDALRHRGPDALGTLHMGAVGLGHARLSILDLSPLGHQPMWNAARTLCIVFNGEIYNYRELRQELQKDGYQFKTGTDTEVILHCYSKYGLECFKKLHGMFALALYDVQADTLVLARDRMGKKPLYWGVFASTLVFASEMKALLRHPLFTKKISPEGLQAFFTYDYVPTPMSIFAGVQKLAPASYLVWHNGRERVHPFWQMDFTPRVFAEDVALTRLDQALSASVADRLVADVPVGVFLSGGLDSSTIAYYAQQHTSTAIQTFSIGFEEKSYDESAWAQTVANFLRTEHHHKMLRARDCLDLVPSLADILDEPLADASYVPTLLLSAFAREKVTVALGGDGGDELFAGYSTFQAEKLVRWYTALPLSFRTKVVERLIRSLPVQSTYMSLEFRLKKFLEGVSASPPHRHQRWLASFQEDDRQKLFTPSYRADLHSLADPSVLIDRYVAEVESEDMGSVLLYLYMRTYMMDQVLVKVDRASMAHALEMRAPFLDTRVVELVNALPYTMKLQGMTTKYILKRLMRGKLPDAVIQRRKKGFGIPVAQWLRNELKNFLQTILAPDRVTQSGFLEAAYVERLMHEHIVGTHDHHKKLWSLLVFQLWYDRWMRS